MGTTDEPVVELPRRNDSIRTLCVEDEDGFFERFEATVEADESFEVALTPHAPESTPRIDDVDCVVIDDSIDPTAGDDLLGSIRGLDPAVPLLFVTDDPSDERAVELLDRGDADVLQRCGEPVAFSLLQHRVRDAVERRRAARRVERVFAAVDAASEGIAIVAPDGTFELVNHVFATCVGFDCASLHGRRWHDVFADDAVAHLTETALPSVEGGWRWSGRCHVRRRDGPATLVHTTVDGLDDGSLVFVIEDVARAGSGGTSTAEGVEDGDG